MASTRLHGHPSLPAPVVHAGFSAHQSKSHVLAGVQDAYWSDDDTDDAECPLCLEEMDISDLNFKPCVCGYQICRFCWHHIKQNLNGRCPACRREYTDEAVQFKAIAKEDHKRLTQQKKQRERERKELEALGRRHLANVRVVQRNVVYVVGIGPRFAKEELIPTLRSNDYFGQYGKISKILLVKRTPSGGGTPVLGLYITYHRREDAARCISTVDGSPSPGGGREVMRASYGTTKYCMAFLRGVSCSDHTCMNLHEWGDEKDCFTKEDLTTLWVSFFNSPQLSFICHFRKHTIKDTESISRTVKEGDALPRAAAWGCKTAPQPPSTTASTQSSITVTQRPNRRVGQRQSRNVSAAIDTKPSSRSHHDRRGGSVAGSTKTPSVTSSSRPPTPAAITLPQRPATPLEVKSLRAKESSVPQPTVSPAPSLAVDSEAGSGSRDVSPVRPRSTESEQSTPPIPQGIPAVPPGLSGPPGLPPPSRKMDPLTPPGIHPSQSTYQISTAAQALLDDVKSRRENAPSVSCVSIFPDLDRTLRMVSGEDNEFGGFSFNLDPKLAREDLNMDTALPDLEAEANTPLTGGFMDMFPALRQTQPPVQVHHPRAYVAPPGITYQHNPNRSTYDPLSLRGTPIERQSAGGSGYVGSFNPFGETSEDPIVPPQGVSSTSRKSPFADEERKVSRFGFARGRQESTTASSPAHPASPLSASDSHHSFFSSETTSSAQPHWNLPPHIEHGYTTSLLAQHTPATQIHSQPQPQQQHARFQPFDHNIVSEAQLREFIQSSRERASVMPSGPPGIDQQQHYPYPQDQPFNDPAIMSARFASPVLPSSLPTNPNTSYPSTSSAVSMNHAPPHMSIGPPPGLAYQQGLPVNHAGNGNSTEPQADPLKVQPPILNSECLSFARGGISTSIPPSPLPTLSSAEFPALGTVTDNSTTTATPSEAQMPAVDVSKPEDASKEQAKVERKAAKKAAAAERALERQKAVQEKAAARAAEKARLAQEKAVEQERLAAVREAKEKVEKAKREKAEQEKQEKERATQQKAARVERDKIAKAQQQKRAQAEKEEREKEKERTKGQGRAGGSSNAPAAPKNGGIEKQTSTPKAPEPVVQAPIRSKLPKKNKPVARPIRIPKDNEVATEEMSAAPSVAASDTPAVPIGKSSEVVSPSPSVSRAQSVDRTSPIERTSLADALDDLDLRYPSMDLPNHPFFDMQKINPAAKVPLEYGPLVHALSALSVGGGSFATNMPSGSIDNAVSSFQQLLETLTQTISDLLRLLPRTTWDDSSSFDGVLRDMLKGDDFLDDTGDDTAGKEDEVAALTLALERRARWMEVQLSKLEELHRDINTAAVRAVLAFNDSGWDRHAFMPRIGNTLKRFHDIGMVERDGELRPMSADELERRLAVARGAAVVAETDLRMAMEMMQGVRPVEVDDF
ncbi:hypothetical protein J3R83DRAFT_1690 [Lanmaoa asiatica]|nr:hypothetical protein J3R83DRAFT_1690 [Lanmaoa asiatica]